VYLGNAAREVVNKKQPLFTTATGGIWRGGLRARISLSPSPLLLSPSPFPPPFIIIIIIA